MEKKKKMYMWKWQFWEIKKKDEDVNAEEKNWGKQRGEARSESDPCHLLTV